MNTIRNLDDILLENQQKELTCLTDLSKEERKEYINSLDLDKLKNYLNRITECFRQCGDMLDITTEIHNGKYTYRVPADKNIMIGEDLNTEKEKRYLDDILIYDKENKVTVSFTDLTHKERVKLLENESREKILNILLILAIEFRKMGDELGIKAKINKKEY